jgi:hypothetical protein
MAGAVISIIGIQRRPSEDLYQPPLSRALGLVERTEKDRQKYRQTESLGAAVAHHADRSDRQEHGESLPDLVVKPGTADLFKVDHVGTPKKVEAFFRDLAGDADRKSRARKRMTDDNHSPGE